MAMNQLFATQQSKLEEKDAEIERLKVLLIRAADMLEKHSIARGSVHMRLLAYRFAGEVRDVIAELRKAAE
jgi:hypothetical protein